MVVNLKTSESFKAIQNEFEIPNRLNRAVYHNNCVIHILNVRDAPRDEISKHPFDMTLRDNLV
jgi:hypothetical protein